MSNIGEATAIEDDPDHPIAKAITSMLEIYLDVPAEDSMSVLASVVLNITTGMVDPVAFWADFSQAIAARLPQAMLDQAAVDARGERRH